MMGFSVHGLDDLIKDFETIAETPEEVIDEMLNAQADVVVKAQKQTARTMLSGPYSQGIVADAIKKNPRVQYTRGGGKVLYINFAGRVYGAGRPQGGIEKLKGKGRRKHIAVSEAGNRIAEIAFINEFGKTNQPARPFILAANEESASEATKQAADVYDKFLKSKGF